MTGWIRAYAVKEHMAAPMECGTSGNRGGLIKEQLGGRMALVAPNDADKVQRPCTPKEGKSGGEIWWGRGHWG